MLTREQVKRNVLKTTNGDLRAAVEFLENGHYHLDTECSEEDQDAVNFACIDLNIELIEHIKRLKINNIQKARAIEKFVDIYNQAKRYHRTECPADMAVSFDGKKWQIESICSAKNAILKMELGDFVFRLRTYWDANHIPSQQLCADYVKMLISEQAQYWYDEYMAS